MTPEEFIESCQELERAVREDPLAGPHGIAMAAAIRALAEAHKDVRDVVADLTREVVALRQRKPEQITVNYTNHPK